MPDFKIHTRQSAPEASKEILQQTEKNAGMVPNLFATLAESPAALRAYTQVNAALEQHAALDSKEIQLLTIVVSRENKCEYCVSVHSALAKKAQLPDQIIEAARQGAPLDNPKWEALRRFAQTVVKERGWAKGEDVEAFLEAGYEQRHVLDIITLIAMKTLSNYTNHIAHTPLDEAFKPTQWKAG